MTNNESGPKAGWYPDAVGRQRWWDGSRWTDNYAQGPAKSSVNVPGRTLGFVCGLVAILFTTLPIVSIPLGIVGWVKSAKALKQFPAATPGRGLALAGQVLSIVALSLTFIIIMLALPGIAAKNFG